jgi:hypothetical protein
MKKPAEAGHLTDIAIKVWLRGHATPDSCDWLRGPFHDWQREVENAAISSNRSPPTIPPMPRYSAIFVLALIAAESSFSLRPPFSAI